MSQNTKSLGWQKCHYVTTLERDSTINYISSESLVPTNISNTIKNKKILAEGSVSAITDTATQFYGS